MHFISNTNISKEKFLSVLLAVLPLSFIAGNLVINLNVFLIITFTLIFYKDRVFSLKYYLIDKLIFAYFFLIIFSGFINYYFFNFEEIIRYVVSPIKSILFLRYLFLYLVLRFLVEQKIIQFKYFF